MASPRNYFLTPVCRLVGGSLYKPQTLDAEGRPLVVKHGPNAGQPRVDYYIAAAVPKGPEKHWSETPWGKVIFETGHAAFPQGQAGHPSFAWKVIDGDSAIPNRAGKKPCDREGYPGSWVISMSGGFAPKIYNADGTQSLTTPDAVKLGYYVQVHGSVAGNESLQQSGVFINHGMVALAAYGPEIVLGPDAKSVGFGAGVALPAGASATPIGAAFNPVVPAAPVAAMPPVPPQAPAAPVVPNPAFLQVPTAPVVPQRVMLPAAGGVSYEAMIAAGWTDALLVQHQMMAV